MSNSKSPYEIRSANTLHGINPYTNNGHIIGLIWIYTPNKSPENFNRECRELKYSEYAVYKSRIAELTQLPDQIEICSSYGGTYLAVKLSHRKRIPDIINAALESGLCIKMQTKLKSFYTPNDI